MKPEAVRNVVFVGAGVFVGFALGVPVSAAYEIPLPASLLVGAACALILGISSVAALGRAWKDELIFAELSLLGGLFITFVGYLIIFAIGDAPKPAWLWVLVPLPPWLNIPAWGLVLFLPGWMWPHLRTGAHRHGAGAEPGAAA